jgi:uncharacterized peroxidase-related enzyme
MPYLTPLSDAQASPAAQPLFQAIQAAFRAVPNIFRTMAHNPAVLKATLEANQAIQHDLDPKLRELAYLKASQVNRCRYCLHYHKMGASKAGLTEGQIAGVESFENNSAYDDLQKDVLRFAEQWTSKGKVEAAVLTRLNQKLTPAQVVTLAATVGLANWTNRFNETFGIELP